MPGPACPDCESRKRIIADPSCAECVRRNPPTVESNDVIAPCNVNAAMLKVVLPNVDDALDEARFELGMEEFKDFSALARKTLSAMYERTPTKLIPLTAVPIPGGGTFSIKDVNSFGVCAFFVHIGYNPSPSGFVLGVMVPDRTHILSLREALDKRATDKLRSIPTSSKVKPRIPFLRETYATSPSVIVVNAPAPSKSGSSANASASRAPAASAAIDMDPPGRPSTAGRVASLPSAIQKAIFAVHADRLRMCPYSTARPFPLKCPSASCTLHHLPGMGFNNSSVKDNPTCKYGDKCVRFTCSFAHSNNRPGTCWDRECVNPMCRKLHDINEKGLHFDRISYRHLIAEADKRIAREPSVDPAIIERQLLLEAVVKGESLGGYLVPGANEALKAAAAVKASSDVKVAAGDANDMIFDPFVLINDLDEADGTIGFSDPEGNNGDDIDENFDEGSDLAGGYHSDIHTSRVLRGFVDRIGFLVLPSDDLPDVPKRPSFPAKVFYGSKAVDLVETDNVDDVIHSFGSEYTALYVQCSCFMTGVIVKSSTTMLQLFSMLKTEGFIPQPVVPGEIVPIIGNYVVSQSASISSLRIPSFSLIRGIYAGCSRGPARMYISHVISELKKNNGFRTRIGAFIFLAHSFNELGDKVASKRATAMLNSSKALADAGAFLMPLSSISGPASGVGSGVISSVGGSVLVSGALKSKLAAIAADTIKNKTPAAPIAGAAAAAAPSAGSYASKIAAASSGSGSGFGSGAGAGAGSAANRASSPVRYAVVGGAGQREIPTWVPPDPDFTAVGSTDPYSFPGHRGPTDKHLLTSGPNKDCAFGHRCAYYGCKSRHSPPRRPDCPAGNSCNKGVRCPDVHPDSLKKIRLQSMCVDNENCPRWDCFYNHVGQRNVVIPRGAEPYAYLFGIGKKPSSITRGPMQVPGFNKLPAAAAAASSAAAVAAAAKKSPASAAAAAPHVEGRAHGAAAQSAKAVAWENMTAEQRKQATLSMAAHDKAESERLRKAEEAEANAAIAASMSNPPVRVYNTIGKSTSGDTDEVAFKEFADNDPDTLSELENLNAIPGLSSAQKQLLIDDCLLRSRLRFQQQMEALAAMSANRNNSKQQQQQQQQQQKKATAKVEAAPPLIVVQPAAPAAKPKANSTKKNTNHVDYEDHFKNLPPIAPASPAIKPAPAVVAAPPLMTPVQAAPPLVVAAPPLVVAAPPLVVDTKTHAGVVAAPPLNFSSPSPSSAASTGKAEPESEVKDSTAAGSALPATTGGAMGMDSGIGINAGSMGMGLGMGMGDLSAPGMSFGGMGMGLGLGLNMGGGVAATSPTSAGSASGMSSNVADTGFGMGGFGSGMGMMGFGSPVPMGMGMGSGIGMGMGAGTAQSASGLSTSPALGVDSATGSSAVPENADENGADGAVVAADATAAAAAAAAAAAEQQQAVAYFHQQYMQQQQQMFMLLQMQQMQQMQMQAAAAAAAAAAASSSNAGSSSSSSSSSPSASPSSAAAAAASTPAMGMGLGMGMGMGSMGLGMGMGGMGGMGGFMPMGMGGGFGMGDMGMGAASGASTTPATAAPAIDYGSLGMGSTPGIGMGSDSLGFGASGFGSFGGFNDQSSAVGLGSTQFDQQPDNNDTNDK